MTLSFIQILFVLGALFAIARTVGRLWARAIPRVWAYVWMGAWVIFGGIAILPKTTDLLAASVGIGRGVDLVVYLTLGALLYAVFRLMVKLENVERQITEIVRVEALKGMLESMNSGINESKNDDASRIP